MITVEDLKAICPTTKRDVLLEYVDLLNAAMREFEISDTVDREAMFLAQVAHESGGFRYVRELASGQAYDVGHLAERLGNTPEDDDDGERYKGRGLIQITGRTNYQDCGAALGVDLLADPGLLESAGLACRSAAWFWSSRGCNQLADKGDFLRITKRINGGTNGWTDRQALWERAKQTLSA